MRNATLFQSHADDNPPMLDINTTPLIDVLLVLLIMMLITLPHMSHAVKIDTPIQGGAETKPEIAEVEIDYDGTIYWNGVNVADFGQLDRYFLAAKASQPDVRVRANRRARYDEVAKVLAAAQRNGMQHIGFAGNEQFANDP